MRDEQADPADLTAHRNRRCGDDSGGQNENQARARQIDAACFRLVLAEGQDIQPPAQQIDHHDAGKNQRRADRNFFVACAREAAHQPIGDFRQLILRVGGILEQRADGVKQRRCDDARQHEIHHRAAAVFARDFQREPDGKQAENQRDHLRLKNAARENNLP